METRRTGTRASHVTIQQIFHQLLWCVEDLPDGTDECFGTLFKMSRENRSCYPSLERNGRDLERSRHHASARDHAVRQMTVSTQTHTAKKKQTTKKAA